MRARIIETAVCYGIFKEILMDDAGFSMGTAPWTEEIIKKFETNHKVNEISEDQSDIINKFRSAKMASTALRFGLSKQVLFDKNNIPTEAVPWTGEMLQRIEALTSVLTKYESQSECKTKAEAKTATKASYIS